MSKAENSKRYDLEDRTYKFAVVCKEFCKKAEKNHINFDYVKQLLRSSSSVAANYIEANESLSKKDFVHRAKICRKESKESRLWLELIDLEKTENDKNERSTLLKEAEELTKIFGSIIEKCK